MDNLEIRRLRATLREMVRELGMLSRSSSGTSLSPLQSHILIELSTQPYSATELAGILCVEKASMSRALRRLLEASYIERTRDEHDGRSSTFKLTDAGKHILAVLEENADRFAEQAIASSSDEEVQLFMHTLKNFTASLRNARRQRESNFVIRPLLSADDATMANIIRNSFRENKIDHLEGVSLHDPNLNCLSKTYSQPGFTYWVAEINGVVVGGGGIAPLMGYDGVCEMQKLFFTSEVKRMGLGRRMIAHILSESRKLGYKFCYLETLDELGDAVCLYKAFGFKNSDRMGATGHTDCNICMLKEL
ncbi:TPA: GNAT family N-acetyltransferase [Klebsiella pneumoniae]